MMAYENSLYCGTGVISTASTALAAKRGMDVTLLSRGQHASELPAGVKTLIADVNDPALIQKLEHESFDAVVGLDRVHSRRYRT